MKQPAGGVPGTGPAGPVTAPPPRLSRLAPLAWVTIVVSVLGAAAVLSGLFPTAEAAAALRRLVPLLFFLLFVVVLAEQTAEAEVFDVLAARIAIRARGNYLALCLFCVLLAAVTTMFLNLDTTAG